jgi:hypothetical protein
MQQIISTLENKYLERFKIFHEQTLFPVTFESLKVNRCPLCSAKLKFPLNRNIALCTSKKHGKPFIIKLETLKKFA